MRLTTYKKKENVYGRGALERKNVLACCPGWVLAAAVHNRTAPDLFINRKEVDRPPWGRQAVASPRKYEHTLKSAEWNVEHVVTRLEPLRVLRTPQKRYHSTPRPTGSIATRFVRKCVH